MDEIVTGDWLLEETHGFDGPMRLEVPHYTGLANEFIEAGMEFGYPHADLNGFVTEGNFNNHVTHKGIM